MSKLMTVSFDTAPTYKTVYVSSLHISPDDKDLLLHLARLIGVHFIHATTQTPDTGIIVRMVALGSSDDWEDIAVSLADDGFTPDFVNMIGEIVAAGFDAVHFDHDFDLIETLKWYTAEGQQVTPLAYGLPLEMDRHDNNYFTMNGEKLYLDDFMRLDDASELKDYGLHASMGESNTSSLFIELADGDSSVNLYRVM